MRKEIKEVKENRSVSTTTWNVDQLIKMASLCLPKEEMLSEKVKGVPVLFSKKVKRFQRKRCCSKCQAKSG